MAFAAADDEASKTANLAARQQAAMRTVAQPMIEHQLGVVEHQVEHSVTSTHAVVIEGLLEGLKPQLAPLGHSRGHFPEDRLKRGRVI